MKKVLVALAMVLGTGSSVVFAQEVNNSSAVVAEAQAPQDEFVKMDPTELPQAILLTLAKNYEGSSVKAFQAITCFKSYFTLIKYQKN